MFLECKVESACEAGKVKPYDVCGYGAHIMGSHIWGSQRCVGEKISLREKCTAATFRPIGRLPGLVGASSASHSVQIARGRLLEKQICTPVNLTLTVTPL